jgi:CRISPR-associated protein Cst1
MNEQNNTITLYPSNWLYNASVIGFINSVEKVEKEIDIKQSLKNTGEVIFELPLFSELNVKGRYFDENKDNRVSSIYRNATYRNYLTTEDEKKLFYDFVKTLDRVNQEGSCDFCNNGYFLANEDIERINNSQRSDKKFLNRITNFNFVHNQDLGPAPEKFPNSYWNNNHGIKICHLCSFLEIHHHLAITKLTGLSQVFLNAPSFRLMYDLNKLVKELYGNSSDEGNKKIREVLATTIIEYTRKMQSVLGVWTTMSIEIVHKYKIKNDKGKLEDRIEFFSLPSDVISIISDRGISNILSDLAEYKILNIVLNENYSFLLELGYKLLREGTKDYKNRNEKLISSILYQPKNQYNPTSTANKILKLYSLIEDKLKRN